MIRVIFLSFLLILTLQARENPFFPSKGEVDIPFTSNAKTSLSPLKRATITVPSHARVIKKVSIEYINLDGTTSTSSINLNNSVDWHLPIFISQSMGEIKSTPKTNIKRKYSQIYNLGFIKFYKNNKEFRIDTTHKMIRNFLLTSPHRVVMDFKKSLSMKSKVKRLDGKYYKKISFGVHKDYYRIVLELDAPYRYTKEINKKGYSIYLR